MASQTDLAGGVTVRVTSPAFAGVASLADAGIASLTDAGAASRADAGVTSLADFAGGVTVGVTSPAFAGVASLADAGVASLTDLAVGVTIGVASLADAGVASPDELTGNFAGGMTFLTVSVGVVTDEKTFLEGSGVRSGSVFVRDDCRDDGPDCFDYDGLGDVDIGLDVTFLTETVGLASPGMVFRFMDMMIMVAVIRIVF